jgi:hypothetical protein
MSLDPPIRRLTWIRDNGQDSFDHIVHERKRPLSRERIEEVCYGRIAVLNTHAGRHKIAGAYREAWWRTGVLCVVVELRATAEPGVYLIITAHPADKRESRAYYAQLGEQS